jgi:ubiquinone/menaquinone biosynthesis C-methylase UbiE
MRIAIEPSLQEIYNQQYKDERLQHWRKLGAIGKAENILRITAGYNFARALEVGAGEGSVLAELAQKNFAKELYAVEISDSGLAQIQQKNIPTLCEVRKFDGYQIPYPDKFFDIAFLTHVLEHVEHERLLLRELRRVSHMQVIEVPRDYSYSATEKLQHFLSYGHINLYTPTLLKYLLLTENFNIIREYWGIYDLQTFTFNAKSFFQKLKAILVYSFKKIMNVCPYKPLRAKFINTITLLCN